MKTSIVMLVLVLAVSAVAQSTQPQQPGSQQPAAGASAGQPAQAPQQKKEIKDPAEYNAYIQAVQQTDPAQKAIALEGFLQQYPNSVMKVDALELLMATYEQAGNPAKLNDTAARLLQVDPNNLRALAFLAYSKRIAAQSGQNPQQNLADAAQMAQRGLQALQTATKPDGMADADWAKFKTQVGGIFNGALGVAALTNKDYPAAQQSLTAAATLSPNDFTVVYPLALADLQAPQPNWLDGLWWIARSVALAPPQMKPSITSYAKGRYTKYHGADDGFDQLLAQAASTAGPPPQGFAIQAAPTPAEMAAKLVQSKSPKEMSFDEIELILTSGNPQAADTVWNAIKDKPIAFVGKLISGTANQLAVAATAEDIDANKADTTITMAAAIPTRAAPKVGAEIQVQATPISYTAQPFMITMTKGELIGKSAVSAASSKTPAKTPAKKGGTTRKRTP